MLISSGQPSLNPRLVKEADAWVEAGYQVTVLYAYWNDWGTQFDKQLLASKKWDAICIGGDPQENKVTYFFSRLIHKLAKTINQKTSGKYMVDAAISRASYYLIREAKKNRADLYIGHNLGALPATIQAAKANHKPCGFDAEDFHRFEVSDDQNDTDVVLKIALENRYLPQTDYLTAGSPLIALAYEQLYPGKKVTAILNVFPKASAAPVNNNKDGRLIKLFWFSQTIGPDRGLEETIKALHLLKDNPFELHLLGHLPEGQQSGFIDELVEKSSIPVYFHPPISPDEIISFASQFDIGLAVEKGIPLNRDICLTNKIFTYIQAGLTIIASDTAAQTAFVEQYGVKGEIYTHNNPASLAGALQYYTENPRVIEGQKSFNYQLGQTALNWETEREKFLNVVKQYA